MNYTIITDNSALAAVCEAARAKTALALDTEFVRTRTYYPRLGLIQLFDGELLSLIDPLTISQWRPFIDLLQDRAVTKFLHAGSEDLEVFLRYFAVLPEPMIDSQILVAFNGKTISMGFAALVESYTQVVLDKSETRADWLARPLTEKQCQYAAADVAYLLPIAIRLLEETEASGWLAAARNECQLLCQRRREIADPQEAWRDIPNACQLHSRQLAALQRLAAWRMVQAREKDLAMNFVVHEAHLWKVARYLPASLSELAALGISGQEIRFHGRQMLTLVGEAKALDDAVLPQPLVNLTDMPGYKALFNTIKQQVARVAEESGLSQQLLASRRQINQFLSWHWQLNASGRRLPELLSGWRGDLLHTRLNTIMSEGEK